jgi:hypothetical protein
MPFTVSIGDDRGRNGLAPCAPLIPNGIWDDQPWEVKKEHCKACPFRFTGRPSCNLDFMTVSDTDPFKQELATSLAWVAARSAGWPALNGSIYEVDFAYYYLGLEVPPPKGVMSAFIQQCAMVVPNEKFWKEWNYRWVEHKEGKPAFRVEVTADVKDDVDKITLNIIEPQKYASKRLLHLYAASALLQDIADSLKLPVLEDVTRNLVEACRRAIMANASLEIK